MGKWELYTDTAKIADIEQIGTDQPWFIGDFHPTKNYASYRQLFSKAAQFIENDDFESEEFNKTFEEIDALCLSIKRLSDDVIFNDVMVNITANAIWWRV